MANEYSLAVARKNEALDAIRDNANSGKLRIYSGTKPANADAALSGNTLLAELTMNAMAYGAASGGVLTANAITSAVAGATGTASFYRIYESDGTTVFDQGKAGLVSDPDANLVLPTLSVVAGVTVSVTSCTTTIP